MLLGVLTFIGTLMLPGLAWAEVSDKAATIPQHWLIALPVAFALYFAGRLRWWLGALLTVVPCFLLVGSIEMAAHPEVGAALLHEQGWLYFVSLFASDLLVLASSLIGVRAGWSRRRMGQEALNGRGHS